MARKGDPRVHLVMNLVLSAAFATLLVTGVAFVTEITFSWRLVAGVTAALVVLTYLAVLR